MSQCRPAFSDVREKVINITPVFISFSLTSEILISQSMDIPIKMSQENLHHANVASDVLSQEIHHRKQRDGPDTGTMRARNGKLIEPLRSGKVLYDSSHDHSKACIVIHK